MEPGSLTEPPPAYDAQEFDRKVSAALDMSLDPALQTVLEEEWEEWSDERFEAAATAYYQQHPEGGPRHHSLLSPPSSSSPPVSRQNSIRFQHDATAAQSAQSRSRSRSRPLSSSSSSSSSYYPTDSRSRMSHSSPPKERPSWYTEAHFPVPARSDILPLDHSSTLPVSVTHYHVPIPDDDFDAIDEPLPPFAPVGPPLDGPPFTESPSYPSPFHPSPSYSTPPPPPRSPPPQRRSTAHQPPFRQRLSTTSPPLSASSAYTPTSRLPPMPIDPGLAYSRQRQVSSFMSPRDEDSGPIDPALLYNSAVASVMKKSKSMQPLKRSLPNRDRSSELNEQRQSFDSQSIRSFASSYSGSSHIPRVMQYAIPSQSMSSQTLQTQHISPTRPPSLPTLPTLSTLSINDDQAESRSISSYYTHPNASQWSQAASSYGRVA